VTFLALYLLQRLKAHFPAAKGSSGHRLFISAFMLASKIICDDPYSNKSWCIVGQGMFALREINQMKREMCSYLEWQLKVDPTMLCDFQARVQLDFAGPGPFPPMVLPQPAPALFIIVVVVVVIVEVRCAESCIWGSHCHCGECSLVV
jgi:hypothetical protein